MSDPPAPCQYEIWWVDLNPTCGEEIQKIRPTVIVGANGLGRSNLRLIVPIIGRKPVHDRWPWMIPLARRSGVLDKDSSADCSQIRSVSLDRFTRRAGSVTPAEAEYIVDAMALCLDIPLYEDG